MKIIALVFVLCAGLQDVLSCPDGFERHGYRCYKVFALHVSWIDAKQYCQLYGADLVQIDSALEESIVEGIVKRLHGAVGEEVYWTDGSDLLTEGEWRWIGQPGESHLIDGYTHWHPGQPDNANAENCLEIRAAFGFDWNDHQCYDKKNFICEAPYGTDQTEIIG
ncbi:perlucin-like isoform X2 [Mizuhopecten yessoensis]|uniref:perlucin-like isoform X2 n=1 Tax=Mizuhopecten yessoensis TaxID=6573 RepID=UPI000B45A347|nr:perlucin-like isoform X2 [Mizuhopecten yessoensis]